MWLSFKGSLSGVAFIRSKRSSEGSSRTLSQDSFSGFGLPDERHGPMRHMCNEPGSRERKAGDGKRKRERGEESRRVALQRLDYGESRESGWTVSLAP